jgi:hypothetical protein
MEVAATLALYDGQEVKVYFVVACGCPSPMRRFTHAVMTHDRDLVRAGFEHRCNVDSVWNMPYSSQLLAVDGDHCEILYLT